MNSETKIYQIPKFTGEHIPVKGAARKGSNILIYEAEKMKNVTL